MPDLAQALITSASERCYDIGETKKRSDREEKMITNGPGQGVLSSSPQSESAQLSSSGDEGSMTENAQAPMSNAIALEDRVIQLAIMGRPNVGKKVPHLTSSHLTNSPHHNSPFQNISHYHPRH